MSSSVLDDCYEVRTCCCCIPLRIGCMWIALAGLLMAAWGAICILFTTMDISHLKSVGLDGELGFITLFFFSALNFLLFFASICLLIGAFTRSNTLVSIYVWFLTFYLIMLVIVMLMAVIACGLSDNIQSLVMFLLMAVLVMIVFEHFCLVTNSFRMRT